MNKIEREGFMLKRKESRDGAVAENLRGISSIKDLLLMLLSCVDYCTSGHIGPVHCRNQIRSGHNNNS